METHFNCQKFHDNISEGESLLSPWSFRFMKRRLNSQDNWRIIFDGKRKDWKLEDEVVKLVWAKYNSFVHPRGECILSTIIRGVIDTQWHPWVASHPWIPKEWGGGGMAGPVNK